MPLNGFVATSATHGHNQQVSFQPSSPNGYDAHCPEGNRGTPSRSAPAFVAEPSPPATFEVNTGLTRQETMAQQQANAATYTFVLLTSDWPSASPHGDNTDAVYEPQHSTAATGAPIHSAGPHRGNNPPAAHAESDSHHRENTLGAYHPLLENAARVIESLTGALQTAVRPPPPTRPPVRIPIPTYRGYGDRVSATDFLENLKKYQQAMGMSDHEILERILPISLVDQAARWLRLTGSQLSSIEQFRKAFRQEFLPADYERRMRRELEQRTQHPDESLLEFVRAMQELFELAEPSEPNAERVERVIRQSHPTFAAYLRGSRFRDLNELASEARRIQGDILAARAYRPPPPASTALEPRCAWNGDAASRNRRHEAAHYANEQSRNTYDISDRALDPYSYERRAAETVPQFKRRDRNTELPTPREETQPRPNPQDERRGAHQNARQDSRKVPQQRCFRCNSANHLVRQCPERQNPGPQQSGNEQSHR